MNIVALLDVQAKQNGERTAIIHGNNTLTYKQLADESCRGSAYLQQLGLTPGDVILVFVPMSIDLYVILMSLWRHGMVAMFLDPASGSKNIQNCMSRVPPKAFIGTPKSHFMRLYIKALRRIPVAISTGSVPFSHRWESKKRFEASNKMVACSADAPALITFTSGSTGIPKGTIRTHGFLQDQKEVLEKTLSLKPGKADLATLPIFALINIACGVSTIIPSVSLKQPGKVDSTPILADIKKHKPQTAVASPAFFDRLLEDKSSDNLRHLKRIFTGGAPVFPRLLQKLSQKMPNSEITAVYGSTEAEPIAEISLSDIQEDDLMKMAHGEGLLSGHVVDEIECCIFEDNWGKPLQALTQEVFKQRCKRNGQPGEIVVHGRHVLKGYLSGIGDKENKFTVSDRIWHRTGDMGYFDAHGRLWLLGRCAAKIVDEKGIIYPFAVETAAMQQEAVKRAALCQVNESRVLVVETSGTIHEIKDQLRALLARFQIDGLVRQTIPVDKRHNAKVDYPALIKTLKGVN